MTGEFTLSPDAYEAFNVWYKQHMNTPPPDKFLEGMFGRKHDHLLRISMVLAASFGLQVVDVAHLDAALSLLNNLENKAPGAIAQVGGDDATVHMQRLKTFVHRYRRIHHSQLLQKMYPCTATPFIEIIRTLVQSGELQREEDTLTYKCTCAICGNNSNPRTN